MQEEYPRKKHREFNKKKTKNRFVAEEDSDKKKLNQEFKKQKQRILEEDDDWETWQEYYNH
jgi:hypothetical protein